MTTAGMSYAALTERAVNDLRLKTQAAINLYRLDECRWDVDLTRGQITFTHEGGNTARAAVQIVGTYDAREGSWMWAWDHPSIAEPLRQHAERLRRYGEENRIEELTTQKLKCPEEDCWRFTALASLLSKAQGAYRGPTDGPLVFMTYGPVTMSKPRA